MRDAPLDRVDTDALVVGAGPAGSAAALVMARVGLRVVLADRFTFPREKACGDALIPDALAALGRLGLDQQVLARGKRLSGIVITAPGGASVQLRGQCAAVPRLVLDDVLREAAVEAGAHWMAPAQAVAPIEKGARVAGAVVRTGPGETYTEIAARWTILACGGASTDVLEAFGVLERRNPSAMAARIYVRVPAPLAATLTELHISFERSLSPGYGWVFPGPDDTFNVGVGIFGDTRRAAPRTNLRELMDRFCTSFLPARQLLSAATATTRLLGAPLRTGLTGARFGRAGLLVAGEAAGTTYSLTGEGIGKALATGSAAGEIVAEALASGDVDRPWEASYRSRVMSELGERFRAYKVAQEYLGCPVVADYLAWRARTGRFARRQLEGLFNETVDARELFSPAGLVRALLG